MRSNFIMRLAIACSFMLAGCGEAQSNQIAPPTSTNTGLIIAPKSATLTGTYATDTGTTTVLVNGNRAITNNGVWTANVRSLDGRYQTVRVELYVNNVITDSHEITIENSAAQ